MATFLDKKEQVYDLKLTSYGRYLLSVGTFKPVYYAFFDDNVIYDIAYAGDGTLAVATATYTQVSGTKSEVQQKTVVLTDALGNTHEITFKGAKDQEDSTSTEAGIADQSTAAGFVQSLKIAIDLAHDEGLIRMITGAISGAALVLAMETGGTDGNGKTIGGTAIDEDGDIATATTFSGGGMTAPPYGPTEGQNNINTRIKEKTPYLESQILFRDVEDTLPELEVDAAGFETDLTPTMMQPSMDLFKFESALGDAMLDAENSQAVPSWKLLMLNSNISSSIHKQGDIHGSPLRGTGEIDKGILYNSSIPQINIESIYALKVADAEVDFDPASVRDANDLTRPFADNKAIQIVMDDPLVYLEEVNTQLLTENFDIEVFEVESGSINGFYQPTLHRRYFEKQIPQVENGFMLMAAPLSNEAQNLTTASVEYHFDVLRDSSVDQTLACAGLGTFNLQSYYVDVDFNCDEESANSVFYDIYGSVTEPEICQD